VSLTERQDTTVADVATAEPVGNETAPAKK